MRIGVNNVDRAHPENVHWYIPSENVHGHIPMESQTCCGLRLSLTRPSMMAGSWVSIRVLHCSSIEAPRRLPRVWHSSFLLLGTAWEDATRAERRKRAAFILLLLFGAF